MREKSQIEDMRAAVRGDIERARARREADPWRIPEAEQRAEPEPETDDEEPAASEGPTPAGPVPAEPIAEHETVAIAETLEPESEPEPAVVREPEPEPEPKRPGFLARLFGRG
jgi:hypothetical protein